MAETMATLRKPTGFSDPAYYESIVRVLGFVSGEHIDANGYNRRGSTVMAVVADENGHLEAVPVHWLTVAALTSDASDKG
jgi:hypothetical protein